MLSGCQLQNCYAARLESYIEDEAETITFL